MPWETSTIAFLEQRRVTAFSVLDAKALTESLTRCDQWMNTFAGAIQPMLVFRT